MAKVFVFAAIAALLAKATAFPECSAQDIISKLNLVPNPEKGFYRETFADSAGFKNRSYSTAIYYLLEGQVGPSYWHRVDAVEVWHHYAGSPLTLELSWNNCTKTEQVTLGDDIFRGHHPQYAIAGYQWQRARSLGDWTLVGTTVAPGFTATGFELAQPDWDPCDGE